MIRLYVVDNHVKIVAKRNQVSIFFFRKCVKVYHLHILFLLIFWFQHISSLWKKKKKDDICSLLSEKHT